jgi:hypothetical protein
VVVVVLLPSAPVVVVVLLPPAPVVVVVLLPPAPVVVVVLLPPATVVVVVLLPPAGAGRGARIGRAGAVALVALRGLGLVRVLELVDRLDHELLLRDLGGVFTPVHRHPGRQRQHRRRQQHDSLAPESHFLPTFFLPSS